MAAFTYNLPTVGGSEDTWGATLNTNWTDLGTFLGSLDSAELAVLDGITATTAELNYSSGVTSAIQTQLDGKQTISATLTAYAGTLTAAGKIPYATALDTAGELDFVDEDDLVSDSDTALPSQQSVKAYVDAQIASVVPSGSVFWFAANAPPTGYLECDGTAISRTTYAALFAIVSTTFGVGDGSTTFNLPDLRGEFIRGWDNGKGTDSGRAFGSFQDEEFKAHTHDAYRTGAGAFDQDTNAYGNLDTSGVAEATSSAGGDETRPRNIALLPCIKV